jgi:hypothetical protein
MKIKDKAGKVILEKDRRGNITVPFTGRIKEDDPNIHDIEKKIKKLVDEVLNFDSPFYIILSSLAYRIRTEGENYTDSPVDKYGENLQDLANTLDKAVNKADLLSL